VVLRGVRESLPGRSGNGLAGGVSQLYGALIGDDHHDVHVEPGGGIELTCPNWKTCPNLKRRAEYRKKEPSRDIQPLLTFLAVAWYRVIA
jgi:hypothetical protein